MNAKFSKIFALLTVLSLALAACDLRFQSPFENHGNGRIRIQWIWTSWDGETPTPGPETPPIVATSAPGPLTEGCQPARELGPWAPNDGLGENFEVTANETVSAGVHVQLWWPAGSGQPWGTEEISVLIPSGLSIEVQDGAGRGWEYAIGCPTGEIETQITADNTRRVTDTNFYGRVDIDKLIATGLVVVRFDRRGNQSFVAQPSVPTTLAPRATTSPSGTGNGTTNAVCKATRGPDSDNIATITAPANTTYTVETWGGALGDSIVVIPSGESVSRTWQGGAIWSYPCSDTATVVRDVSGRNKPVFIAKNGALTTP